MRHGRIPVGTLGRFGLAFDVVEGGLVGRDQTGLGPRFDAHVADRHPAFHRQAPDGGAAVFDDVADATVTCLLRHVPAAVQGIDSAIARACAYVEAGADMIFPEAMKTLDDYRRFKQAVRVPILANLTEFGSTPFLTTDELRGAGVDIALYCCGAYRAMNKAALHFYETVRRDGTQKHIIDTLQTRVELYDVLDYHAYEAKLDQLFKESKG